MRKSPTRALGALVLALASALSITAMAGPRNRDVAIAPDVNQHSVMTIPANAAFPVTKRVALGTGKSFLVQFPFELKDVLVADPTRVDAVVQSADRVFLIAKKAGQTNAFFFDANGQQVLTIEVTVGADLSSLDQLLRRLIPGSNVKTDMAGKALVLTGSVRTPIDSSRAADIAERFAEANTELIQSVSGASSGGGGSVQPGQNGGSSGAAGFQVQPDNRAGSNSTEKKVINLLAVEGEEQVMLKVVVAEVQRTRLKQLGINVGAAINAGNFSTRLLTANALPLTAAAGLGALPVPGLNADPDSADFGELFNYNDGPGGDNNPSFGNSGLNGRWTGGKQSVSHALRALERDGLIKTLAEPNLTAVSGEAAKFLAGGEYPVPVVDSSGQISVVYKEFGVGVSFTPVVLSEGRISLKIETEVSELTNQGAVQLSNLSIPALRKRTARSTVELPSGGSLAMAGLLSEDTRQNIDGLPGLKDVPILGTLFRSRDFIKQETELVVIVTPYMVRPTSRQNLARPLDGLADASDMKANFLGHLNRIYGRGQAQPVGDLKGDYGFIVE